MRKLIGLGIVAIIGCSAEVHTNVPPPPQATVTISTPPPPTVVVETPPPPTATVVVQTPPPPVVVFEVAPPPPATVQVHQMRWDAADGRPSNLHAGAPEAYWIWHEDHGHFWHLRTTTHTQRHRFQGTVIGDGGPITEVKATANEFNDHIRIGNNNSVTFDFSTQGNEDGFDFKVAGSHCVRFYMSIDGHQEPNKIHVGRANVHPTSWHFKLCPGAVHEGLVAAPPPVTIVVQAPPPPQVTVAVTTPPPPPPPQGNIVIEVVPTPPPSVQVHQLRWDVAEGRPAGLHQGAGEAFWIWHEDHGHFWHLRTTTHSQRHRFQGVIMGDGGPISELKATAAEFNNHIRIASSNAVNFDFQTQGNEDGFDFRIAGNHCVRFYMTVDGKSDPQAVHIGRGNVHPNSWHFKLCP